MLDQVYQATWVEITGVGERACIREIAMVGTITRHLVVNNDRGELGSGSEEREKRPVRTWNLMQMLTL